MAEALTDWPGAPAILAIFLPQRVAHPRVPSVIPLPLPGWLVSAFLFIVASFSIASTHPYGREHTPCGQVTAKTDLGADGPLYTASVRPS
jgi:hypothetical protein